MAVSDYSDSAVTSAAFAVVVALNTLAVVVEWLSLLLVPLLVASVSPESLDWVPWHWDKRAAHQFHSN